MVPTPGSMSDRTPKPLPPISVLDRDLEEPEKLLLEEMLDWIQKLATSDSFISL